ncbi:MAG: hypothetical protein KGL39_01025 [Patescibacteria group bacterium]|nr:hypothetical protein [Patescibacteria group bacterium]
MTTITDTLGAVSASSLTLTSPLAVSSGGTGQQSFTAFGPICTGATATSNLQSMGTGSSGQGVYGTSTAPAFVTLATGTAALGSTYTKGSTTPQMVGINASITPAVSGKVLVMVNPTFTMTNTDTAIVSCYYATSPYSRGNGVSGTLVPALGGSVALNFSGHNFTGCGRCALVTGLTVSPSTTYYFDLAFSSVSGSTMSIISNSGAGSETRISIAELPL